MSPLLEVRELTVRYGGTVAVDRVSLSVEEASFVGVIGPNGAGKTSFLDGITGYARSSGDVIFEGVQLGGAAPHVIARHGMIRSFQSSALFDDLTVLENILIGSFRGGHRGFWRSMISPKPIVDPLTHELIERFGLEDVRDVRARELSTGRRKLVGIARGLAARPRMALLDEPAAGLDTHESEELGETLSLLRAQGLTIVLIDHDMDLVLGNCDVINVLNFGGLLAAGPPEVVQNNEEVRLAYLGSGAVTLEEGDPIVAAP